MICRTLSFTVQKTEIDLFASSDDAAYGSPVSVIVTGRPDTVTGGSIRVEGLPEGITPVISEILDGQSTITINLL